MAIKAKKPAVKKSSSTKKKPTAAKNQPKVVKQAQLPSPLTPILAAVAAVFTYVAFSLAIDSGSYWHYLAGFYFVYQTVRLTRITIQTRRHDKTRRASKA